MSRCKTGWRIYFDPEVPQCCSPWTVEHERGLTHYRSSWESAKAAMTKETLLDWEMIDGAWRERIGVQNGR